MKGALFSAALVVVALGTGIASAQSTPRAKPGAAVAVPQAVSPAAPADEYFGRLKLSILGIRNTIKDTGLRIDAAPARATVLLQALVWTEDAVRDWERKYPRDSWLPGTIFSLERVYAKVDSDDARSHAVLLMAWLVHDYPADRFGKLGRQELAQHAVGVKPSPTPGPLASPGAPALEASDGDRPPAPSR